MLSFLAKKSNMVKICENLEKILLCFSQCFVLKIFDADVIILRKLLIHYVLLEGYWASAVVTTKFLTTLYFMDSSSF